MSDDAAAPRREATPSPPPSPMSSSTASGRTRRTTVESEDHELEDMDEDSEEEMPNRRHMSAASFLEALESLSHESAGTTTSTSTSHADGRTSGRGIPPGLRNMLGQLHGMDAQAGGGLFPFAQFLDGSAASGNNPRFRRMLDDLAMEKPAHVQMSALSELCETLSMSTEEVLDVSGFSVEAFVPAVAKLVASPPTFDVLLLAARALAAMLEMYPISATPRAVHEGVIPSLCHKLLEIEYMDVAELAMRILERIITSSKSHASHLSLMSQSSSASSRRAQEYRSMVLEQNGFVALLQFLDFFPVEIQRTGARIVSQLCTHYPSDLTSQLRDGLPYLTNLLRSFDAEIVASGCEAFRRLADSHACRRDHDFASLVLSESLLELMLELLTKYGRTDDNEASSILSASAYNNILRFLSSDSFSYAEEAPALITKLRFEQLPPVLSTLVATNAVLQDTQSLRETLKLVSSALPSSDEAYKTAYASSLRSFAHDLVPKVMDVYDRCGRKELKHEALAVLSRTCAILYTCHSDENVESDLHMTSIAAFLARVIRPKQSTEVTKAEEAWSIHLALQVVEQVVDTHEPTKSRMQELLERHGVASALRYYASLGSDKPLSNKRKREEPQEEEEDLDEFDNVRQVAAYLVHERLGTRSSVSGRWKQLETIVYKMEEEQDAFEDFVALFQHDSITAHEVASSGLVEALSKALDTPASSTKLLQAMEDSNQSQVLPQLVDCLHAAISSDKDTFTLSTDTTLASGSVATDLERLTQHVKVRVHIEASDEEGKTETTSTSRPRENRRRQAVDGTVVLVEPLARIETIEGFIADKILGERSSSSLVSSPPSDEEDVGSELSETKERRVHAVFQGQSLPPDMSILEAIIRHSHPPSALETNTSRAGPFDITFRLAGDNPMPPIEVQIDASDDVEGSKQWSDTWDMLSLLQKLQHLCLDTSFINPFLSMQVARALEQAIRVVTTSLPAWSFRLVHDFPFVLDVDTRYHFMYATTCGPPRAIQYLARNVWKRAIAEEPSSRSRRSHGGGRRSRTSALTNLTKMVKLPRLKVRVARGKLLVSARKLLAIYGGKRAMIEIEFLGEVGTGLGPTTEFFTLVAHEIQARKLRLWRDESAPSEEDMQVEVKEERETSPALPVRGYHRFAVYYCASCCSVKVPKCSIHKTLLTHDKRPTDGNKKSNKALSVPQCSTCLDAEDDASAFSHCDCHSDETEAKARELQWWILTDDEVHYLSRVYPQDSETLRHPVLQCAHCDTVNFPGTDDGIVTMDRDRMLSRLGRRMYERDYRAVTKHVSPLCEGTPLKIVPVSLTKELVDELVENVPTSPEVLESDIDSMSYVNESTAWMKNVSAVGEAAVDAPFGLYPKPYMSDTTEDVESGDMGGWFKFLGQFVAQALLDERLLSLPLSRPFMRLLRGEQLVGEGVSTSTSLSFLEELDPTLAKSLGYLYDLASQEPSDSRTEEVEDMCLSFTLVGTPSIELVENGSHVLVSADNLMQYVQANLTFFLRDSVQKQVSAFHRGFEQTCGLTSHATWNHSSAIQFFQVFSLKEMEEMLSDAGRGDLWDRNGKDLRSHIVCAHGYSASSRTVNDLIHVLCELTLEEQRLFVRFVTGANRLPRGGWAALEPKFTVVRKHPSVSQGNTEEERAREVDALLPSASTCTNYLKLPEYSSRDVLKERLQYCIREGQCSFLLS